MKTLSSKVNIKGYMNNNTNRSGAVKDQRSSAASDPVRDLNINQKFNILDLGINRLRSFIDSKLKDPNKDQMLKLVDDLRSDHIWLKDQIANKAL